MDEEEKINLETELRIFKSETRADLYIFREKIDVLVKEFNSFDDRFEKNEKDIQGVADSLRDKMSLMETEIKDEVIKRTEKSNMTLFQILIYMGVAVVSAFLGHMVK